MCQCWQIHTGVLSWSRWLRPDFIDISTTFLILLIYDIFSLPNWILSQNLSYINIDCYIFLSHISINLYLLYKVGNQQIFRRNFLLTGRFSGHIQDLCIFEYLSKQLCATHITHKNFSRSCTIGGFLNHNTSFPCISSLLKNLHIET